jgi:hypothetical protein
MDFQAGGFEAAVDHDFSQSAGVERRSEPRHEGLIDCATLFFRGAMYVVPVVNISSRGTMIESDLEPRLGESVRIQYAGCSPIYAFVRWSRDGRIGLNFGCELTIG